MNAFVVFCSILILLFISEAQHRANLVITDAKVKHIPPTKTVPWDKNCVQKDGMTHKYLQSDTSFKGIYYLGKIYVDVVGLQYICTQCSCIDTGRFKMQFQAVWLDDSTFDLNSSVFSELSGLFDPFCWCIKMYCLLANKLP